MRPLPTLLILFPLAIAAVIPQIPPQKPLQSSTIMPGTFTPTSQPAVHLTDILGTHRSITTFSSLTRQHDPIQALLSSQSHNTTILAPLNSAVEGLPHKPWEPPGSDVSAFEGEGGKERADANLLKFVRAHLVERSPWVEGEKVKTIAGREIWWESKGDRRVIKPDGVEVEKVASRVGNGEVWILKGVLKYI